MWGVSSVMLEVFNTRGSPGGLSFDQTGMCHRPVKFTTLFWSGKPQNYAKLCIVLYCIVLYCIVLYCIVLCCIVWYSIISYRIVPYRTISYRIVSYRIVSYSIVSYHIVSYRIVSYRIVSYRIVSYRIVSYRIVLDTRTIFMLYLFNQMILPFHFSSTTFVQKSFKEHVQLRFGVQKSPVFLE